MKAEKFFGNRNSFVLKERLWVTAQQLLFCMTDTKELSSSSGTDSCSAGCKGLWILLINGKQCTGRKYIPDSLAADMT